MLRPVPTRFGLAFLAAMTLVLPASRATAKSFQPDLGAFLVTCTSGNCDPIDIKGFKDFSAQLASALMARFPGPIATLGSQRLEVNYTVGLSELDRGRDCFTADETTGRPAVFSDPSKLLTVGQIQVRKGIPHGLQLGGSLTQVFNSNLWDLGVQFTWTPLEGIRKSPDLGIQLQAGTVLGASDLILVHAGAAVILSRAFNVAGLFSLAPFVGYQFMYVSTSTHLTGAYRQDQTQPTSFAIDPQNLFLHRGIWGLEAVASWVVVAFEMTTEIPSARRTYAFRFGAQF